MVPLMTNTLRVRPATTADLDAMARMGAALAYMHHGFDAQRFMYADDFERGYRWWFDKELRNREVCFRVVDVDEAAPEKGIAGYVYGRLEDKQWNDLLDEHAALVDVFVEPSARGKGIGVALVRAFCEWADQQGAPRVVLSTATQNAGAQKAFAKAGFRPTMIEMTRERGSR
jgi:RimJ/RimL family protein N-acetyltransferase